MRRMLLTILTAVTLFVIFTMIMGDAFDHTAQTDPRITQLVRANDAMQAQCGGYAVLEAKPDGSSEVIGHCP